MDGPPAPVPAKANAGIDEDVATSAHGDIASMDVTTAYTSVAFLGGTSSPVVPRSWPPPVPAHHHHHHHHHHHRKDAIPLPLRSNEEASPSLSSSSSTTSESLRGGAAGGAKAAAAAAAISIESVTEFQKASYQTNDLIRHRHVVHPLPVSHHPTDQQGRMVRPSGECLTYVSDTPPPPPPTHLLHQANVLFGRDEQIQELEEIFEEVLGGGGGGDGDGSALGVEVGGGSVGGGSNTSGSGKDTPFGSGSADGAGGTAKAHGAHQQQQPPQHGSSNNRRHPQRRSYKSTRRPSASTTIMPTCTKQVVWIEGRPGTGKSALAMQTKEPCRRVGGFYLTGKFQQPFSFQQRHGGDEQQQPQQHQQQPPQPQQHSPSTPPQAGEQRPYSALGDACMDLVDDLLLVYYNENESVPITHEAVTDRIRTSDHDVYGDDDDDEKNNEDDGGGKTKSDFSSNYHRWTMSGNEVRQAFSENRQQLEILIPIIRNLPKLLEWEDSSPRDGHLDGRITDDRGADNNSTTLLGSGIGQGGGCYVEAKQAVQYAFARFFVILGRFVPITVLVLDDWQWADDSSVDLVESLLLNESIHHLLMVNTIRTPPSSTPPSSNSANNNKSNDKSLSYFLDRWKLHIDNWMAAGPRAGAIAPNQSGATATTSSTSHTTMPPPSIPFKAHEISTDNLTLDDLTCWLQTILYGDASSIGIGQNDVRHSITRNDTPEMRARDLAQCVHKRTVGNPLYVRQFLLSLLQQGLLTQVHDNNGKASTWEFDVDTILGQAVACDNVVSFLSSQLLMMGEGGTITAQSKDSRRSRQQQYLTRILPKLAALGTTFSFRVFEIVANDTIVDAGLEVEKLSSTKSSLQVTSMHHITSDAITALLANLDSQGIFVVDRKRKLIRWVHDKLREAALTGLMVEEEVPRMKFELGRLLLEELSEVEIKRELFLVTNLLNAGPTSIGDARLLNQIILLNQQSGKIALMSSAFTSASEYCAKGMRLLPELQRWTDPIYYPITLDLYSSAAEALFCTGNHESVYELYDEITSQKGIPLIDKRRICNAKLNSLAAQGRTVEAKVMTISVLSKLGCKFPRVGKSLFTIAGIIRALRTIDTRTEKIATLKRVESAEVQWVAYLLDRLITCAYQCDADLLPLAILKGLRYTIDYGITDLAAPILATVGLLLATAPGDVNGGIKYAELAVKYSNRQTLSRTLFIVNVFVLHFRLEYPKFNGPLLRGYEAGMESGDLESSCWCAYCYVELQLFTGKRLSTVLQECEKFYRNMEVLKQDFILWSMRMLYQLLLNLKNKPSNGHMLQGEIIADEKQLRQEIRDDSRHSVSWQVLLRLKLWLSFWFGEYQTVVEVMEEAGYDRCLVEKLNPGYLGTPVIYLQCAISCLSVYRQNRVKKYMKLAQKFLARLKDWVNKGNKNIQHGEALIQAEIATFGNQLEATKYYDVSNLLAGRWGIVNDQAFSHERLGNFLEDIGQEEEAYLEYEKALEMYSQWGARCRINRMLVLLKRTPGPVSTVELGAEEVATTTVITDLSVI